MSAEHGIRELPGLIREDLKVKAEKRKEERQIRDVHRIVELTHLDSPLDRAKFILSDGFKSIRYAGEMGALGAYLSSEDGLIGTAYTQGARLGGKAAAVGAATAFTYGINRMGTKLFQKHIASRRTPEETAKQVDEVPPPEEDIYLTAKVLSGFGLKRHQIQTLLFGSYFGADQEQLDERRENKRRLAAGEEPVAIDDKYLDQVGKRHTRYFTGEIAALSGLTLLGERYPAIAAVTDPVINTISRPEVIVPAMLSIYAKRYARDLRGVERDKPTLPRRALSKLFGPSADFYNPNIKQGSTEHREYWLPKSEKTSEGDSTSTQVSYDTSHARGPDPLAGRVRPYISQTSRINTPGAIGNS